MARPLLPIVPLLMANGPAHPPVPSQRVTGNVSTEHHERRTGAQSTRPVTDACRVTGNLMRIATKSATPEYRCRLTDGDTQMSLSRAWFEGSEETQTCGAEGTWVTVDAKPQCRLQPMDPASGRSAVDVPAAFAVPVPPEGS